MDLMRNVTIRFRVIVGFLVSFVLLATVAGMQYLSFHGVNETIQDVVEVRQPRALAMKDINTKLRAAASQLGFFASTGELELAQAFSKLTVSAVHSIESDETLSTGNPETLSVLRGLSADISRFQTLGDQIIKLGSDQEANYPGVAYANAHINPVTLRMTQQAAEMLRSEIADGEADDTQAERLGVYSDLRDALSNLMRGLRGYLAFRAEGQKQNTLLYMTRTHELLEQIGGWPSKLTFEQEEYLSSLLKDAEGLDRDVSKLLEIHGSERWRTDAWLLRHDVLPLLNGIEARLDELVDAEERQTAGASQAMLEDAEDATHLSTLVAAIGLLAGIVIAVLITRSIAMPICAASNAMAKVADGEGDLTRRLAETGRDELSTLAGGFNKFVAYIQEVISQTARTTSGVIGSVASTNDAISRIAERIGRQQKETDQVATAITEMSASVAEVAQSATHADEAAKTAFERASNGKRIVNQAADGIENLAGRLTGASELMQRLDTDAQSIRGVIDVIRSIAEQTNLLALNAAIEAARAGESGRGFAVVADEVRTLANRTHQSTEEISDMIARLGSSATEAVHLMTEGRDMAESNTNQAREAIGALSGIEDAVRTISELNEQIATAVEQQRAVAENIHSAVHQVNAAGRDNTEEAAHVREAAVQLGDQIADLQKLVSRFKIDSAELDFEKAKSAHLAWRARVRNFLDGKGSLQAQEVVSHRECVLGKWYYGEGLRKYGNLSEMRKIEAPHERLHALIGEIIDCQHHHDDAGAEQRFGELATLSNEIVGQLDRLESQITSDPGRQSTA